MLTGAEGGLTRDSLIGQIEECTADYEEKIGGARRRLNRALEVIIMSYYANIIKRRADALVAGMRSR